MTFAASRAPALARALTHWAAATATRPATGLTTSLAATLAALLALAGLATAAQAQTAAAAISPVAHHTTTRHAHSAKASAKASPKPGAEATDGTAYGHRPAVQALAQRLAEQQQLDPAWVERMLAQARRVTTVERLIMPAPVATAKNWAAYRARFVEPNRIQAGVAFWQAQADWLAAAEARYGVPAQVVVGIIGVETFYGRVTGNFRVLDALATLSLGFPRGRSDRSAFFQDELGQFLALAHRQGLDPLAVKGSFAGAIGLGQFMPGSINRFAVDFDGDGHIDMANSPADVVGSVAHYLAEHGWQAGQPSHFAVQPPADAQALATLLAPDILPTFSVASFQAKGAVLEGAALAHTGPLALVELQNGSEPPSYVAGTDNFYAVTRYNWSSYYAMAVIELGEAVAREFKKIP